MFKTRWPKSFGAFCFRTFDFVSSFEFRVSSLGLPLILVCTGALLLAGCAGYQVGPTNGVAAGTKSIQVQPFQDKTLEPRVGEYLGLALRRQLMQDGTYRLDTHGEGDIVVRGVIKELNRGELSFSPTDVLTPRDYTLSLLVQLIAVDRATGRTNVNRLIAGHTTIRAGSDLGSAERQAVPLLAEDAARNVVSALADGAW